ncbi:hypothetical protein [Streptomyces parvulus]|uniref:hypothetical protein n=1 Tax=Streptomyces parvulus TaxID=146923 RepID=UPI0034451ACA
MVSKLEGLPNMHWQEVLIVVLSNVPAEDPLFVFFERKGDQVLAEFKTRIKRLGPLLTAC